jgi:hypothetical protein
MQAHVSSTLQRCPGTADNRLALDTLQDKLGWTCRTSVMLTAALHIGHFPSAARMAKNGWLLQGMWQLGHSHQSCRVMRLPATGQQQIHTNSCKHLQMSGWMQAQLVHEN